MNTTQLSCFVEVASTLSFSRAAEHLHLSQPAVSHQVKALENELGVDLLVRSTRSVRLTDEGMAFLGYAQEIVELAGRAKRQLDQGITHSARSLRIGVHDGLEARLFSAPLARLHQEDPEFDPQLRLGPNSALRDMLENGTIDVMMEYRSPKGESASATTFRALANARAVCMYGSGHVLAQQERDEITLDEILASGRIAATNPRRSAEAIVMLQRELIGHADADQVMMCPSIEIAITLAAAGIACTILADLPPMHEPDLVMVPVVGLNPVTVGVRTHRGRRPQLLEHFIEVLGETLGTG